MKYGVYYFRNTHNLGDDIWAYAQSKFLPSIDYLIDNTTAYAFNSDNHEKVACIIGAFVEPYNFEYSFLWSTDILPFFCGAYFRPTMYELFENNSVIEYLKAYEPIGCRSTVMVELLRSKGVNAYFSGCISLTLPKIEKEKEDYICLVDVSNAVEEKVREKCGGLKIIKTTHVIADVDSHSKLSINDRFNIVEKQLEIYSKARCVITSRLHVALPCLTQNTPVLLVIPHTDKIGVNDITTRIQDYFLMLNHCYEEDFISGKYECAKSIVSPNPDIYIKYRKAIIESCKQFVNQCEKNKFPDIVINSSTKIDILENKIIQLKNVIDQKNELINSACKDRDKFRQRLLEIQARLRKYETYNEWEGIEYFRDTWAERSKKMSYWIKKDCRTLLDLGCGEMHIKKFLKSDIKYYGCDYKKRDVDTIICDLSQNEFPQMNVDCIFIAGVLEYLVNWNDILREASCHTNQILMCYSTLEAAPERDSIWVNAISSDEIINLMAQCGFILIQKERYLTVDIFDFEKEV